MLKRLVALLIVATTIAMPQLAHAGTLTKTVTVLGQAQNITLTTPDTYSSCVDATTSDTITMTGVGSLWLKGQVIVDYVVDGGRQTVQTYPINQQGDLTLTVEYPPVSQWPVLANGTREIHVDVQIEVFYYSDQYGWELLTTFGPGQDWDVFCLNGPPPPSGGQGCTPGYWKQKQHFDSWTAPYTPQTTFASAFGVGPNITLLQALQSGGGGEQALLRHATAALLNSASGGVDYAYTTAQVITLVKDAYANQTTYEGAKDLLAGENERGCPLN
jgi:hypothetical protein